METPTPTQPIETKPVVKEKKKPGRKKKPIVPIKIVQYETPITITFD